MLICRKRLVASIAAKKLQYINYYTWKSIIYTRLSRAVVLDLFEVGEHFWLYEKFAEHQN